MATKKYTSKAYLSVGLLHHLNEETADVHFVFGAETNNPERVPAHKFMLTPISPVFAAMFNGSWKEKDMVPIDDTPIAAFKEFLQFFYLEKVQLSDEQIERVINLAEEYDVAECKKVCGEFLQHNLTDENLLTTYGLATFYNIDELTRLCEAAIKVSTESVFGSAGFLSCKRDILGRIMKLKLFCSPMEVFEACMAWVKNASKQDVLTKEAIQTNLGDLFYDIPFGAMKMNELSKIFDSYPMTSVFSAEEHKDIVQTITAKDYKPVYFSAHLRQTVETEQSLLTCKRKAVEIEDEKSPYNFQSKHIDTFSSNQHLLLKGIVWCNLEINVYWKGRIDEIHEDYECALTITETDDSNDDAKKAERVLYKQKVFTDYGKQFLLPRPIAIRPEFKYNIHFDSSEFEEDLCTFDLPYSDEVELQDGIVIKFSQTERRHQNDLIKGGIVKQLIFIKP